MRNFDTHTARALQEMRLEEARITAERRESVLRRRRSLRFGLAARLSSTPKRTGTVTEPEPA
jgi:hypothetical protein